MGVTVWMLVHNTDGAAIPLGATQPRLRDDGCYWLGPHMRFRADGTVENVGTRTTRYSSDVWVLNRQVLRYRDAVVTDEDRAAMVRVIFDRSDWCDPLDGAEKAADDLIAAGWRRG